MKGALVFLVGVAMVVTAVLIYSFASLTEDQTLAVAFLGMIGAIAFYVGLEELT